MGINKVNYGNTTLIDISSDTVTAGKMLSGTTAHDNSGAAITGTIATKTSSDLTDNGYGKVTVPAGYYASEASKQIGHGTEGTPYITKEVSISTHTATLTPWAQNSRGWITGNLKGGSDVTVTASELVDGNKAITANGTDINVANYATVSVSVSPHVATTTISNSSGTATALSFTDVMVTPKAFALRFKGSLSRSSSSSYYYITTIVYDGTHTYGNYWRMSTGNYYDDTTHYSWSMTSASLFRVASSGSRGAAGGSFANGTYELVYVY